MIPAPLLENSCCTRSSWTGGGGSGHIPRMQTFAEPIGYLAATLTTIAFLPQLIRIWRTRSARDVSLPTFVLFTTGVMAWLLYGVMTMAWPVIAANTVTLVLAVVIILLKLRYG